MQYVLLLRGINLGKQNKVSMIVLKKQLIDLGFLDVVSYLNTGNILFKTDKGVQEIVDLISELFRTSYSFNIPFVVISSNEIMQDFKKLPNWWWNNNSYRRDALFYLRETNREIITEIIENQWNTNDLKFFIGETALFVISNSKEEYQSSLHSKKIMKSPFNKIVTLRNNNTFNNVIKLLIDKSNC